MLPPVEIPAKFVDQILQLPEYSYGVTRVVVTLQDGVQFRDVFIAWGREIVKVGEGEKVPFDPQMITHVQRQ